MSNKQPKKIGLLIGREWSWPTTFIKEIERRDANIIAEFVKLGGTFREELCDYNVIIDRMSHKIPYYRTYMKYAALHGINVINNPFRWSADDKFFGVALAHKLGIATPKSVVLPNKRIETHPVPESFRNLVYPMDWEGIINYVGEEAILKDVLTGGRRISRRVSTVDQLIEAYDSSDTLTVILQQVIESDNHIHCFVIGQEKVLPIRYSMKTNRYLAEDLDLDPEILTHITHSAKRICQAYSYDMNMVEFVIDKDTPYLINPSNPAPDIDIDMMSPAQFTWCVTEMADFAIELVHNPRPQFEHYSWSRLFKA